MIYKKEYKDVISEFKSEKSGLSNAEAKKRLEQNGFNELKGKEGESTLKLILNQFKDPLVIILIIAAIVQMFLKEAVEAIIIIAVVILNAILGVTQTKKAEGSLNSLKKLSSPSAKVLRGGEKIVIPAREIVNGDIVCLESGDYVPADGRVIESQSLKSVEGMLTGESEPVLKVTDVIHEESSLGDQKNMVFSGSTIVYGRGMFIVTATGMNTEVGKIANLLEKAESKETPLQKKLDQFSKRLGIIIMILAIIIFGLEVGRAVFFDRVGFTGELIVNAFMFSISVAVAAIPEALSSIVTIVLASGTNTMAKRKAIIRKLPAVETLGATSIICTDKTGTLTQNKMTVEDVYCYPTNKQTLLISSIMCNDTAIVDGETFGDPTETAFVDYYMANNDDYTEMMATHPRIGELPFDSERKLMSTLHDMEGKITMFTKGAPDVLIEKCRYFLDANGQVALLSEEEKEKIKQKNFDYSSGGLRVLAFAMKTYDALKELDFDDEKDLVFIGLEAEMDPPRVESAPAVEDCIKAGIKPIMITGDHKVTASAIAKKIGILQDGDKAITGPELDEMDDETLAKELPHISVYARVSPDNKIRIVNAWQELGHIVAMTGDGVNDAPALKQADIGIAMGITGTEVSKDASAMILTDDNFATIIKSVLNGRNIYANIKNAIKFLLSGNAAGIFSVLYASLAGLPAPFAAVHLLFINLLTDSLPALAISMEPSNEELIKDKPRSRDESILTKAFVGEVGFQGILIAIATMAAFYIGYETSTEAAMTMAFSTLCLARLWHGFNSRGKQSIFKLGLTTNVYTIGAFFLGLILLSLVLFVPFLEEVFSVAVLSWAQIGWIALLAFLPTVVIQIKKIIVDHMENK